MRLDPMKGRPKNSGNKNWRPDPAIDLDELEEYISTNPGARYAHVEARFDCSTTTARKYCNMLLEDERIETRKDKSSNCRSFWPIRDEDDWEPVHIDIRRQKLAAWTPEDWGIDTREYMR